jgi:hypothetical protein
MLDTLPIPAITRLIATGTTERALLASAARRFPHLSAAELSKLIGEASIQGADCRARAVARVAQGLRPLRSH